MSGKSNQSGFAPVVILIIVAVIGGGLLISNQKKETPKVTETQVEPSPITKEASTQATIKQTSKPKGTPTPTAASTNQGNTNNSVGNSTGTGTTTSSSPTPNVTTTPTSTPTPTPSTGISVSTTSVSVTLSRAHAYAGRIYGDGVTITSHTGYGILVQDANGASGVGLEYYNGGLLPGQSRSIRTNITTDKANGVYTGQSTIKWTNQQNVSATWGTVYYSITLTD